MLLSSCCGWWVGDNPKNAPDIYTGLTVVFSHHNVTCITSADCPSLSKLTPRSHISHNPFTPMSRQREYALPLCNCPKSMFLVPNFRHFGSTLELISSPTMAPETRQHFTEIYCDKASRKNPTGDNPCIWDLCSPHRCVQQLQSSLSSPREARTHI